MVAPHSSCRLAATPFFMSMALRALSADPAPRQGRESPRGKTPRAADRRALGTIVGVVVAADYPAQAELVAGVLRQDHRLRVLAVAGHRGALQSPAVQEGLGAADVLLYVAPGPIRGTPWREHQADNRYVLVIFDINDEVTVGRALRAGALGYVSAWELPAVIPLRVLQAAQGEMALPPEAVAELQRCRFGLNVRRGAGPEGREPRRRDRQQGG